MSCNSDLFALSPCQIFNIILPGDFFDQEFFYGVALLFFAKLCLMNTETTPGTVKAKPAIYIENKPLLFHFVRNKSSISLENCLSSKRSEISIR